MRRFRGASAHDLVVRDVDGMHLIYHYPSGATHLLAPELTAILRAIAAPANADEALAILARDFDVEAEDGDARAAVAARLEELVSLGLADAE